MGTYIAQVDLESALSPQTIAAIYDDGNTGTLNAAAIALTIERAEALASSFLVGFYTLPLVVPTDGMMRSACLDFAISLSFDRAPEYVRQFGEGPRSDGYYSRGVATMQRIQAAVQKLPDEVAGAGSDGPRNVGGIIYDQGPRTMITGADGRDNGSGF